jgi:hypothetical protein
MPTPSPLHDAILWEEVLEALEAVHRVVYPLKAYYTSFTPMSEQDRARAMYILGVAKDTLQRVENAVYYRQDG